jgi:hypothetical protein
MAEMENELKTLAQRMILEKWEYKEQTKKYVRQVMGYYTQERLMKALEDLNYKELKMIAGCGIPGDAWRYSVDLLRKKKDEIDLFVAQGGVKASATIEHEPDEEENPDGETGV